MTRKLLQKQQQIPNNSHIKYQPILPSISSSTTFIYQNIQQQQPIQQKQPINTVTSNRKSRRKRKFTDIDGIICFPQHQRQQILHSY